MTRILIQILLPLLVPTVLFFIWRAVSQRLAPGGRQTIAELADGPWGWLAFAGVGLVIMTLVATALLGERIPQGEFVPPRVVDGKIEPAHRAPK